MNRFFYEIHWFPARAFLLGALLCASTALWPTEGVATTARIAALGGNGAFFEDDANVLRWCGSLTDYPDLAVLETGSFNLYHGYNTDEMDLVSGPGGGVHGGIGENDRWGTAALYFRGRNLDTPAAGGNSDGLNGALSLIYARPVGPFSGAVKFRHGEASSLEILSSPSDPEPRSRFQQDLTETGLGGGLRMELSATTYLDLAGEVRMTEYKNEITDFHETIEDVESGVQKSYEFRSRAFIKWGENSALIPIAEIMLTDTPLLSRPRAATQHMDHHLIRIGCGWNYFPDTDRLLLASIEYRRGESEFSRDRNDNLPMVQRWKWDSFVSDIGAETRILSWMSLRTSCHYEYRYLSESWTNPALFDGNPQDGNSEAAILYGNLGMGVHLGSYDLDLAFTNGFPSTPTDFIGYSEFRDSWSWLTATLRAEF